jgi:uncharacterized protein with von Willebrand factor type A (vWA) domain
MYPFGTFPHNVIAFSRFLRERYAFRIGPGEIHDAARALDVVDLSDERAVRHALRPILSAAERDARVFDQAFAEFFFPGPPGAGEAGLPRLRDRFDRDGATEAIVQRRLTADATADRDADDRQAATDAIAPAEEYEPETGAATLGVRSSYSPVAVDAGESPELSRVDPEWRDAARLLVRRLTLGLTRRWRPAMQGRRFDLRRTLRASVQTGGEPLSARWLRRPRRTPRVVVIVDGSRSMGGHARTALQVAVAIAAATMRVEVFTFSTALRRVTAEVRRAAAGEPRRLHRLHHAWAGGTSIGACLDDFLRRFGERMVTRDTVVMIASDGLDVGAPDTLRDGMRELRRRSAGVVWLNPLLDTPGYEPTARGMRAARPYISTFASVNDAAALARLARRVRVRQA